jgi:hypothetical protein
VLSTATTGAPDPAVVGHVAYEPTFSVWGIDVAFERATYERATLRKRPGGFDLSGRASATVTSRADFAPGQEVRATVVTGGVSRTVDLVADAAGRVAVALDLGGGGPVLALVTTARVDLTPA